MKCQTKIIILSVLLVVSIVSCVIFVILYMNTCPNLEMLLLDSLVLTSEAASLLDSKPVPTASEVGTISHQIFRIDSGLEKDHHALTDTDKIMGSPWTTVRVSDVDADTFWQTYFPEAHLVRTAYYLINPKFGASRADILRLALLYIHGGIYLDYKSALVRVPPPLASDKQIGTGQWRAQLELFPNGEFTNWLIIGRAGSMLLWFTLKQVALNVHFLAENPDAAQLFVKMACKQESDAKRLVVSATGPIPFSFILSKYNKHVDANYGQYAEYNYIHRTENKHHYSKQNHMEYITRWQTMQPIIPKKLYMTYMNLDLVPSYVMKRVSSMHPELQVCFFTDHDCRQFLCRYFPPFVLSTFDGLKVGAHKADLWRYCVLYIKGGFYCDIKTDFRCSLMDFVSHGEQNTRTWYTVIGYEKSGNQLYNGILITPPFNPILYENILFICRTKISKKDVEYLYIVKHLYKSVQAYVKHPLRPGANEMCNGWTVWLAKETCVENNTKRYGIECEIHDETKVLVKTRCDGFGQSSNGWM